MHRPSVNVPIDVEGGLYSPLHDAENDGSAPEKAGDESKDLEVTLRGLSSAEAAARLERHGRNEIPEEVTPWYVLFFKQFVGTMPVMLEIACVLALIIRDYPSFGMIVAMLVINASLGFYEEQKAQASDAPGKGGGVATPVEPAKQGAGGPAGQPQQSKTNGMREAPLYKWQREPNRQARTRKES